MDLRLPVALLPMSRDPDHMTLDTQLGLHSNKASNTPSDKCNECM